MTWSISKLVLGGGAATMLAVGAAVSGAPAVFAAATPANAPAAQTATGKHDHRQDRRQVEEAVFASEADVLTITPEQLRDALKSGKSVQDLANDRGMNKDEFEAALVVQLKPRLDKLVDSGAITRKQADRLIDRINHGYVPFWDRHDHKHK